jgi:putative iron-regulated protein
MITGFGLRATITTIGLVASATAFAADPPKPRAVLDTYADIAAAMYGDALVAAKDLEAKAAALVKSPSEASLQAAKDAWLKARVPYQQTEVYRFGNAIVDDFEGKVNAWPLDEGLIDYVDGSYGESSDENPSYRLNIIANPQLRVGKQKINARKITPKLLESLHEAGEVEANVATGYHAIEFLLWGQDLNGTGPGAGKRPFTDYAAKDACTGGNCDRRGDYLNAASKLLVADLRDIEKAWGRKGAARAELLKAKGDSGLVAIFTGLGSLAYGELAGERMKLGLILHDPEEEHDCFSDNTHNSHYYDIMGMKAVWEGSYTRTDGTVVSGPSPKAFAEAKAPDEAAALTAAIAGTVAKAQVLKDTADSGKMAYDQMLGEGNAEGNKIVQDVIDALVAQTRATEALVAKLGLKITVEGSDSLDNPSAVQ